MIVSFLMIATAKLLSSSVQLWSVFPMVGIKYLCEYDGLDPLMSAQINHTFCRHMLHTYVAMCGKNFASCR